MIPMKGGDEMTLVQPEGVPTPKRDVVSMNAWSCVGRRPEPMTGPTPQGGCRQTAQAESNDCQGRLIATPVAGNTIGGAHDAPGAAPSHRVVTDENAPAPSRALRPLPIADHDVEEGTSHG